MGVRLGALAGALVLLCAAGSRPANSQDRGSGISRPRLVVLIAIDQFRADYLTRFQDLYRPPGTDAAPGGFRYFMSRGAWHLDCHFEHHRTVTAAGHAILGTGAQPYINGMVGNDWFDRLTGKPMYCVADPNSRVVGASAGSKETPMSAANLLTTTFADELELATGGRARTVSISIKDRATILLIGHRADTAVWMDELSGGWISSSAYCARGTLPEWVTALNARRLPEEWRKEPWKPSVKPADLARIWNPKGGPVTFEHALTGPDYNAWISSPSGNRFVFESAKQAVAAEELGRDATPDVLTLSLASNDYVGHSYGPESAEVLDISVETDRQLSDFLGFLHKSVPGGLKSVSIAISADHGVVTVPELNADSGVPAMRAVGAAIASAADQALDREIGSENWIASMANGEIYLSRSALEKFSREPRARLEGVVMQGIRDVPGVHFSIGRTAVLAGQAPANALGRRITQGVHPGRSGDVIVILEPQWLPGSAPRGRGTSHGTPFTYDTHVPMLLAGYGVRPGVYGKRTSPAQLAPSLAHVLGCARPSAADEPLLPGLTGVEP